MSRNISTVPLAEIMTRRPAVVSAEMPLGGALDVMGERGISSVLVTGPTRAPYGILTLRDLVAKVVRHGLDPATLRAWDIATWRLITADASWTVQDAASAMAAAGIRRLPVVQRGELLGVISDTDLFIALVPDENWEHARAVRKARAAQRARPESGAAMVGDLMSAPALTVDPSVTVQRAVEKMVAVGVSSLLAATGTEGHPAGIVTKRDVVTKLLAQGRHPSDLRVDEIMSAPVRTIESGASLEACSTRMAEERPSLSRDGLEGRSSGSSATAIFSRLWWGISGVGGGPCACPRRRSWRMSCGSGPGL